MTRNLRHEVERTVGEVKESSVDGREGRNAEPQERPRHPPGPSNTSTRVGRKHKGVSHIRERKLTEQDMLTVDPGRDPSFPYEDDPPWAEVAASLTHSRVRLPTVFVRHHDTSNNAPHSQKSLYHTLLRMVSPASVPPLFRLIDQHNLHWEHQSAESYNFIISIAIQQDNLRIARQLFTEMDYKGFEDIDTRKLRVRYLLKMGAWMQAWRAEIARGDLPLSIWLEFALSHRELALRQRLRRRWKAQKGVRIREAETPSSCDESPLPDDETLPTEETPPTDEEITRLLLQNFPALQSEELRNMPPRVIFCLVRWMIKNNRRELVWRATLLFFKRLPPRLTPRMRRICLDIVHLHLLPYHNGRTLRPREAGHILGELLNIHQDIRPDATTLFHYLRTLRGLRNRTTRALQIVHRFKARWGSEVVDDKVLRRIASFAASDGKVDLVSSLVRYRAQLRRHKEAGDARWQNAYEEWSAAGERPLLYPRRLLFPRRGAENWRWYVLSKRAQRLRGKIGTRRPGNGVKANVRSEADTGEI